MSYEVKESAVDDSWSIATDGTRRTALPRRFAVLPLLLKASPAVVGDLICRLELTCSVPRGGLDSDAGASAKLPLMLAGEVSAALDGLVMVNCATGGTVGADAGRSAGGAIIGSNKFSDMDAASSCDSRNASRIR
jgi:hypothetical protein